MGHLVYPITTTVVVDDIETTMETYDQIQVHRSTDGESGTYVEVTPISRPELAAGQTVYDHVDADGSPTYWYKFRYYNSSTSAVGSFSDAAIGERDAALDILSVNALKTNYLFGLDLTRDDGTPYPDSLFAFFIKNAVSWLEHKLDIKIARTDYADERHDFYRDDYRAYIFLDLLRTPIISVEEVKLVLPGDQTILTFDQEWIHVDRLSGQIQMIPGIGAAGSILLGAGGAWLPFIYGGARFIPDAFRVTYTAGFGRRTSSTAVGPADPDLDTVPSILTELVGKIASFGPLNIAGDLLGGAGIASQCLCGDSKIRVEEIGDVSIIDYLDGAKYREARLWTGTSYEKASVFTTGEKLVCFTALKNGLSLLTSPDHRFETVDGFVKQSALAVGMEILCDWGTSPVLEVQRTETMELMFDASVYDDAHRFVANGIRVHNSIGIDGLSTSFSTTSSATNAGYGARILSYGKEIRDQIPTLMRYYKGIRFVVV